MRAEIIELTELVTRRQSAFGEYLVEHDVIDRFQLFRALQMQDRVPGVRLGQCAVALGYVALGAIEALHDRFAASADLETMTTTAFQREGEISEST